MILGFNQHIRKSQIYTFYYLYIVSIFIILKERIKSSMYTNHLRPRQPTTTNQVSSYSSYSAAPRPQTFRGLTSARIAPNSQLEQQRLLNRIRKLEEDFSQERKELEKKWEKELSAKDEKIREFAAVCVQIAENSGKAYQEKERQIGLLKKEICQLKEQAGRLTQKQIEGSRTKLALLQKQCQLYKAETEQHKVRFSQLKQEADQCMSMAKKRLGLDCEIGSIRNLYMKMEELLTKTQEQLKLSAANNECKNMIQGSNRPHILQNSRRFDSSASGERTDYRDRQQAKSLKKYESKIKDMKEKIEKYEKSIKILKQENEKLNHKNSSQSEMQQHRRYQPAQSNQTSPIYDEKVELIDTLKKIVNEKQSEIKQLIDKIIKLEKQVNMVRQSNLRVNLLRGNVSKLQQENSKLRQTIFEILRQKQELLQLRKQQTKNTQPILRQRDFSFGPEQTQMQKQVSFEQRKLQELLQKQSKIELQLNRIGQVLRKNENGKQQVGKVVVDKSQLAMNQEGLGQIIKQKEVLNKLEGQCEAKRNLLVQVTSQLNQLEEKKTQFGVVESNLQRITIECSQRQKQLELLRSTIQKERQVHLKQRQNYEKIFERIVKERKLLQMKLEQTKNQLEIKVSNLEKTKGELLQKKKQIQDIETKLDFLKNERQRSPNKPVQMQAGTKGEEKMMIAEPKPKQRYFESPAMLDMDETNFIVSELLKANPHSRIKKVKLLYKYPLMQGSNPYDRIYDHPNYVVVVKLKNGMVVAMYSQIPLNPRESHGRAFIASVTNRKAFPFREDCDIEHVVALHYSGHLIFGNGELSLGLWHPSYLKAEIHPDLRSFETVGEKGAGVFVGNFTQKKYDVTDYEIFQIEFEEEEKK